MLIFWGSPRDPAVFERAREFSMMWGPLCALAFMTIVSGRYLNLQPLLESSIKETQAICRDNQMRDDFFEFARISPVSNASGRRISQVRMMIGW